VTDGTRASAREIGDDATAEVAERAREELWTTTGTLLPYAAGAAILFLEPQSWSTEFSMGATAFLLVLLGTIVWQFGTARGREDQARRLLSEYAVLRHVDPGVGRRAPADEAARDFVRGRFLGWFWLVGALALPATERQAHAGRRWRADPPGPPRD